MKTIVTTLAWPDGASVTITGAWQREADETEVSYGGETARLLALMPWTKELPQHFSGIGYHGMWNDIAQRGGLVIDERESGDWKPAEL